MILSRRLKTKQRFVRMARKVKGPSHGRDFDREFWRRAGVTAIMDAACRMMADARAFGKTERKKIPVDPNFRDLLSALNRHHARYLVVGAYAVMRYTEPRYTKDLDIWVDPTTENAGRVFSALADFGAPLKKFTPEDFTDRYAIFQFGVEPRRVDVLTGIAGVRFQTAWENRETSRIDGVTVHFIGLPDLMRNKKQVGRPQDLIDLANLKGET